jgi:succinate-semialdehyde dehydrogenase / glutarate-semialdehyde dehydrogenase
MLSAENAAERTRLALNRADLLRDAAYIDGHWVRSQKRFPVFNPATEGVVGHVPLLERDDVQRAVESAERAQQDWQRLAAKERSTVLRRWFDLLIRHTEDLARLMTAEQGKPLSEARAEIAYAAAFVEWFAEEAKRIYGDMIPGHQADKRLMVLKQPVGVVAAITPWNFPAAMITRKVAPALAVGCAVVLKPSELTPLTALAIARLAEEAGVPAGVFNVLTGDPREIGDVLVADPRVRKLTFTGSTAVGKLLAARCMDTVKRVSLELGGNAPFIVFADADLDRAVEGAIASKFRNSGQTCVCANRFLVHEAVYESFAERLAARARSLVVGDGLAGDTQQGPLINSLALEKVEHHVADAVRRGARVLAGGTRTGTQGHFFSPTVLSGVGEDMVLFREETFGPVAGLMPFRTEQEAIRLANNTPAGLAAYLYTRDANVIWRVGEALRFGMVGVNTGLISTEVAPFGGVKESGLGREGSRYGAGEYLDLKLMCSEITALST